MNFKTVGKRLDVHSNHESTPKQVSNYERTPK